MSIPGNERSETRALLLARRAALDKPRRDADDLSLRGAVPGVVADLLAARAASVTGAVVGAVVGAYWPIRGEPDLRALFEGWSTVALPCVVAREHALIFRRWSAADPMAVGAFGIPEPRQGEVLVPDVLVLPCLGFFRGPDGRAYRLGYGGGFYDRTLAQRPTPAIGVAYDWAEVSGWQPAAHDMPLDCLITPTRRL